jgi:hypothetical protein
VSCSVDSSGRYDLSSAPPVAPTPSRDYASPIVTEPQLEVLFDIVRNQGRWLHRIVETFEVEETRVRRSVSLTMTVPNARFGRATRLLVPVMPARRGQLIDNLDVEDGTSRALPVLSRAESEGLCSLIIDSEFERLLTRIGHHDEVGNAATELTEVRDTLASLPFLDTGEGEKVLKAVFHDPRPRSMPLKRVIIEPTLKEVATFFVYVGLKFVELTNVRPGERVIIKYSYDSRYYNTESTSRSRLLGQRPYTFRFETPLAFLAPSYHVRMQAPDGHYCFSQSFEIPQGGTTTSSPIRGVAMDAANEPSTQNAFTRLEDDYEHSSAHGLPYAHLYVTHLDQKPVVNLTARLKFFEFPPGQTGRAFSGATVVALILIAIAGIYGHVVRNVGDGALFLALLGVVALWMRPSFDPDRLLQAPLSARLGLSACGVLALVGALDLVLVSSVDDLSGGAMWAGRIAMWVCALVASSLAYFLGKRVVRAHRRPGII